ncbi:hypothetical protein WL82_28925 [Burkholderia ubonensis]|uniref:GAP1-N1 domain-containing protein n=1 Tax=Burkholderia ubonensis TaxID=101571 RepID=UPI000759C9AB|nr:hypothetical protein [Burkholderia ubonensis]KWF15209.1 hypothetical protein WL82_28925 [Burkholderia ubonensis]
MTGFDQQLHGYRQGHQLLSSTIRLPKADQDLIDRLSDVAGPLSPGERFSPYLTLYPLPSETYYVVARTWQDLEAPRAGCVRTRSVLIPMSEWQEVQDLASIVAVATEAGADKPAERRAPADVATLLPPVEPQQGTELIEALFLEERAPIVVFDAEAPELLALRLTTALWPGFRRTFSMSTFARSPRTIGRRSFDLVFASKEARPRFADWNGRRIDGRKRGQARHPWSAPIVDKILSAPVPSLKSLDALGEMSSDGIGSESALRVSLLWDDLRRKLPNSPTAALGMLDIANTRKIRQVDLIRELEPELARSAAMAATTMQAEDAWRYLGALVQKLEGRFSSLSFEKSIRAAAIDLASGHPIETLDVISALTLEPQKALLVSAAGDGLSRSLDLDVAERLSRLDGKDLLDLLFASASLAEGTLGRFPVLSFALAAALRTADDGVRAEARRLLLGLLVDDTHVEAARLLVSDLDTDGLVKEAGHLNAVNGLSSAEIRGVLVERARALQADAVLRDAVSKMGASAGGDALVEATLRPTPADMYWLLTSPALKGSRRIELIRSLLVAANLVQLHGMLADQRMLTKTIALLNASDELNAELLSRIACNVAMPSRDYVTLVVALLPKLKVGINAELVVKAIELALPQEPNEVSPAILDGLLSAAGDKLNGGRAMRVGLQQGVSPVAASRNLVAFGRAPDAARRPLLTGIEEMAVALTGRRQLDISTEAAEAAAKLLWESRSVTANGFVRASTTLLPIALDERREVASPLIAAAFPPVYRELAKEGAFDLLSLMFVFLDWDKCKSARRRLIDAFVHSEWRMPDIAIAAVRAGDPVRILGRIARERGGEQVLRDLVADLKEIPEEVREPIRAALKELGLS